MSRDMFCPLCRNACRGDCAWLVYDASSNRFVCAAAALGVKFGYTPTKSLSVSDVMDERKDEER